MYVYYLHKIKGVTVRNRIRKKISFKFEVFAIFMYYDQDRPGYSYRTETGNKRLQFYSDGLQQCSQYAIEKMLEKIR